MIFDGTSHHWDASFIHLVYDWELEFVADFLDVIYSVKLCQGEVGTLCRKAVLNGIFSVNFFYKVLLSPNYTFFLWKCVWKPCVPSKINFFVWTASLGGVLTIDNLWKRHLMLLD